MIPRAPAIVFALLVLATLAAFAYAQRVKRDPLVLDRVSFVGAPRHEGPTGRPRFHPERGLPPRPDPDPLPHHCLRRRNGSGDQARRPRRRTRSARDEFLKRYTFHTYYWDGRQRGGGTANPGRYKLRVKFGDRTLVTPGVIRLHPAPKDSGRKC